VVRGPDLESRGGVLLQGEITRKGRSKVGQKERLKKNVIALFLSLSLSLSQGNICHGFVSGISKIW
jgi:hypothetical protein